MTRQPRILIATAPFDGHFNPLTSLAKYLQGQGYDVRWYTARTYEPRLRKLDIPFYPFVRAQEINQDNLDEVFAERKAIKNAIGKIKFDIKHLFVRASVNYFEDIREIHRKFPFDLMVIDTGLTAGQLVKEVLNKPVVTVGVMPLMETSKDLYPNGLALTPKKNPIGRLHQAIMRLVSKNLIFKEGTTEYNRIIKGYGLQPVDMSIFDIAVRKSNYYLQIGSPGFEYYRSDLSPNVRFIGPLLPHGAAQPKPFAHADKMSRYAKIILVSQGTVDNKDPEKLMVPTLEAYKDSPCLVIAATGGMHTEYLRKRFPHDNIIIEDFVDYGYVMPRADAFVTCGGYGSVMLSISHRLPMVAAGMHEGKNEINARIGYFKLGINLKTERPTPAQVKNAVTALLADPSYRQRVATLRKELIGYNTLPACEGYIRDLLPAEAVPTFTQPAAVAV
ncbi:MAG: glycosyltransferase family 1 protein [Cytophagales bacterium]|nr:glycosyltransferase family 1 protein [Cytophagales bacterium]